MGDFPAPRVEVQFIHEQKNLILVEHTKLFWPIAGRVNVRSPSDMMYWQWCIQLMHDFVNNHYRSGINPIDIRQDPLMRLKRKRLAPTIDLKARRREQAEARAMETAEGGEEDIPRPFTQRKGNKTFIPQKRKQVTLGSTSAPKRTRVFLFQNFICISYNFLISSNMYTE